MSLPPRPSRTIRIYDAGDNELMAPATATSKAQRSSIQGRADQKQIDRMCLELVAAGYAPTRVELHQDGSSLVAEFRFDGRRSMYLGSGKKAGQS